MGRALRLGAWLLPIAFIGIAFYWPLGNIAARGLTNEALITLADPRNLVAIWFTLWSSLASVALCLVAGIPLAYALYRTRFLGSVLLRNFMTVPFVLPTIVVAMALQPIRWLDSWLVILIANVFLNLAVVVRTVGSVWRTLDLHPDAAAELDGASKFTVIWRIHLPQLRSAIFSAAALVFLYCATSFGIVLVLGSTSARSIETVTYFALNQRLDFNTASALALVQTLITVIAFAISTRRISNQDDLSLQTPARANRVTAIATWFCLACFFVIPLGEILVKGLRVDALVRLSTLGDRGLLDISVWQALGNSLRNAIVAAAIAMLIGTLVAKLSAGRPWVQFFWVMPLGISAVMLGFGYLVSFGAGPLPLRSSWLVVPLVQAVFAVPLVVRQVASALGSVPIELAESAATAGAGRWQIWRTIEAPLLAAPLRNAAAFALLVSIGEFGAASLLSYGDQATLPVVLYRLISRPGESNYSMALATAALLILFAVAMVSVTSLDRSRRRLSSIER
ncbi:MAG: ABC transporter permease [Micrococcales bacterium]